MNHEVACAVMNPEVARLRSLTYSEIRKLVGKSEHKEVTGPDGKKYQLQIEAFWDSTPETDIRVIIAIDDGGLSAFKPLINDFIIRPDGTFVVEGLGGY